MKCKRIHIGYVLCSVPSLSLVKGQESQSVEGLGEVIPDAGWDWRWVGLGVFGKGFEFADL